MVELSRYDKCKLLGLAFQRRATAVCIHGEPINLPGIKQYDDVRPRWPRSKVYEDALPGVAEVCKQLSITALHKPETNKLVILAPRMVAEIVIELVDADLLPLRHSPKWQHYITHGFMVHVNQFWYDCDDVTLSERYFQPERQQALARTLLKENFKKLK